MASRQNSGRHPANSHNLGNSFAKFKLACNKTKLYRDLCRYANLICSCFWATYATIEENYLAVCTIFAVLMLTFLLPDFSHKVQVTKEVKTMQKVLDLVSKEVNRAEVACLTAADEICCMHCSVQDDATETSMDTRDLSVTTSACMPTSDTEPVHVEKKIGFLRRIFFPSRNASHKEIAIMSYVYTNSFDAKKPANASTMATEFV